MYHVPTEGRSAKGAPGSVAQGAGAAGAGTGAAAGAAAGTAIGSAAGAAIWGFNGMYLGSKADFFQWRYLKVFRNSDKNLVTCHFDEISSFTTNIYLPNIQIQVSKMPSAETPCPH